MNPEHIDIGTITATSLSEGTIEATALAHHTVTTTHIEVGTV